MPEIPITKPNKIGLIDAIFASFQQVVAVGFDVKLLSTTFSIIIRTFEFFFLKEVGLYLKSTKCCMLYNYNTNYRSDNLQTFVCLFM